MKKLLVFLCAIGAIFGISAAGLALTDNIQLSTGSISEPATMLMVGAGLVTLAGLGRKKFFKK
jgi:hypothetical protein